MEITLRSYSPFTWTYELDRYAQRQWSRPGRNFLDSVKKITMAALSILAIPFVFPVDLVVTGLSLAYRACVPPPKRVPIGIVPDRALIQQILTPPYGFNRPADSARFLKDAIREAFGFLAPNKKRLYQDLIVDGLGEEDGNAPNMYRWCAAAYIAHYLRSSVLHINQIYPFTHPILAPQERGRAEGDRRASIFDLTARLHLLSNQYHRLDPVEQGCAILKTLVPETEWDLTPEARRFVTEINKVANKMLLDDHYRLQVYAPLLEEIENF